MACCAMPVRAEITVSTEAVVPPAPEFPSAPAVFSSPVAVSSVAVAEAEPYLWPVAVSIEGKRTKIVSEFGKRSVLDAKGALIEELHEGIDFSVPEGSSVHPSRSGRVIFAGFSKAYASRQDKKDKNHLIIVMHPGGWSTRYVHLNRLMVTPGEEVTPETVLGTSSQSDEWTEPVVHFEIRNPEGKAVNPEKYLELKR